MVLREFIIRIVTKFVGKGFKDADKAGKDLAKTADKVRQSFDKMAKSQLMAAKAVKKLADENAKAARTFDKMTRSEIKAAEKLLVVQARSAESAKSISRLKSSIKQLNRNLDNIKTKKAEDRLNKFKSALSGVGSMLRSVGTGLAAVGAIGVGVAVGVLKVGVSFEQLRARLKTVEGSAEGANRAFSLIQNFAKTTPFEIDNLTQGFTQLRVRGVKPTVDVLTGLGDLTSAFGLTFTDVTDAIGAAARGELDPIEKFGISAKIAGDQIKLSFKGQTIEVKRSAEAVTDALVAFGQMEGVQGAMADQSATAGGMISNLKDAVSTFLDTVSQLGVVDEFKLILGELGGLAGNDGFAGIIAGALVNALKALRLWLANITEQEIESFLESASELAGALVKAIEFAAAAMEVFTIASGGTSTAIENMTVAVIGLVAAFMGPAGLVVAAGAVGFVLGQMLGNLIFDLDETNDRLAAISRRIADLRAQQAEIDKRIAAREAKTEKALAKTEEIEKQFAKKGAARVKTVIGGAGAGLVKDLTAEEKAFRTQQILRGTAEEQAEGREALLTAEGRQVLAGVEKAEAQKIADVEKRARREARGRGASAVEQAEAASGARASAQAAARANREKALESATKVFAETGSAEAATLAAQRQVGGRGKKGKAKKGKAGKTFFDFEKKAKAEARSRGEAFAAEELERLVAAGEEFGAAQLSARAAGEERAEELEERFKKAGKIIAKTKEDSILDILGLRGPGAVLEGRPAPEVLTINIAPIFNLIAGDFTLTLQGANDGTLEAAAGAGAQAAVERGLTPSLGLIEKVVMQMFALQGDRIIADAGGGRSAEGPPG